MRGLTRALFKDSGKMPSLSEVLIIFAINDVNDSNNGKKALLLHADGKERKKSAKVAL